MLNLQAVMIGLQYLFLEPNADDPLNKGARGFYLFLASTWRCTDAYFKRDVARCFGDQRPQRTFDEIASNLRRMSSKV